MSWLLPLSRRGFVALFLALTLSGCTVTDVIHSGSGTTVDQTAEVLPLINQLRASHGLPALTAGNAAMRAAADQANRMALNGEMEHNIGFGADFKKRMDGMKVPLPAAENIAAIRGGPQRAFEAWVNSPKHLANMLGSYSALGVAVSQNSASASQPYWAMVLSN